jgi:hypothetical protein
LSFEHAWPNFSPLPLDGRSEPTYEETAFKFRSTNGVVRSLQNESKILFLIPAYWGLTSEG